MRTHTLIHEYHTYALAILVLNSLSASTVAGYISSRWLDGRPITFTCVYCTLMVLLGTMGLLVVDFRNIIGGPISWILAVPFGCLAGHLAGWSDRAVLRYLASWRYGRLRRTSPTLIAGHLEGQILHPEAVALGGRLRGNRIVARHWNRRFEELSEGYRFNFWSLVSVAVLEEFIYRGVLLDACFLLRSTAWIAAAVAGTIFAFSLMHLRFGWSHVLAKAPLGALSLLVVLATGTVLSAIIAHVYFNVAVWIDQRL